MAVLVPVGLARYFPSANHIIININPRFIATPPPFYMEKEREREGGETGRQGNRETKEKAIETRDGRSGQPPSTKVKSRRERNVFFFL